MFKKFILRILLFSLIAAITLVSCLLYSSYKVKSRNFKNSETESNTLFMRNNQNYNVLLLGISHARNFSRYHNHERMEKMLNKRIINLAQGEGKCGVNEQLFYLQYFYAQQNKVDTLIYVLTPPLFTSEKLPLASNTFDKEVFDLNFLYQYLHFDSENKYERIVQYTQTKLRDKWLKSKPDRTMSRDDKLAAVDKNAVESGMKSASGEKFNSDRFAYSCTKIEETILLAKQNNTTVMFIIPPALFGKWKEHQQVVIFADKMKSKYNIKWGDFSESILEPQLYYDHHHLNTNGVIYFTETYLRNFLNN